MKVCLQTVCDSGAEEIEGNGPAALGARAGGLGYSGIPKSVAIQFDLSNNSGKGSDSTGLYTNGAAPTAETSSMCSWPTTASR